MKALKTIFLSICLSLLYSMMVNAESTNEMIFTETDDTAKTLTVVCNREDENNISCTFDYNVIDVQISDVIRNNDNTSTEIISITPKYGGTTNLVVKLNDTILYDYNVTVYRQAPKITTIAYIYKSNIHGGSYINFNNIPSIYNIHVSFDNGTTWYLWNNSSKSYTFIPDNINSSSILAYIGGKDNYTSNSDKYNIKTSFTTSEDDFEIQASFTDRTSTTITASCIYLFNNIQKVKPDTLQVLYSIDGEVYQDNNIFTNLRPNVTYNVRAKLYGKYLNGEDYNKVSSVSVTTKACNIITMGSIQLNEGIGYQITGIDFDNATVYSEDESVATINTTGKIIAKQAGKTNIHIIENNYEYIYNINVVKKESSVDPITENPTVEDPIINDPTITNSSTEEPNINTSTTDNSTKSTTTEKSDNKTENQATLSNKLRKVKIIRYKAKKKSIKLVYTKIKGIHYQIQISRNKRFKGNINVYLTAKNKWTIRNLKRKTKYYIRIRTYKVVGNTIYYSKWSKVKKIKTK